jgi:ABC-type branched-subunit amino acid transport system substrate-binding protein
VWRRFALEVGRSMAATFAETNAAGGLLGRPFELLQVEYEGDPNVAMAALLDRYPLVAFLTNVVPASAAANHSIPPMSSLPSAFLSRGRHLGLPYQP